MNKKINFKVKRHIEGLRAPGAPNSQNGTKQAEAEVVPSSSLVEVEVEVGVEVDAILSFRHSLDDVAKLSFSQLQLQVGS